MPEGPERRPSLLGRHLAERPLEFEVEADLVVGAWRFALFLLLTGIALEALRWFY
jgi:hypothetical protein